VRIANTAGTINRKIVAKEEMEIGCGPSEFIVTVNCRRSQSKHMGVKMSAIINSPLMVLGFITVRFNSSDYNLYRENKAIKFTRFIFLANDIFAW
jgi:hypothetical protein